MTIAQTKGVPRLAGDAKSCSNFRDEAPHIFTRKPRLRPLEFLIIVPNDFCNTIGQKETHALQQTTCLVDDLFDARSPLFWKQ